MWRRRCLGRQTPVRLSDGTEIRLLRGRPLPGVAMPSDFSLCQSHSLLLLVSQDLFLFLSLQENVPCFCVCFIEGLLVGSARSLGTSFNGVEPLVRRETYLAVGAVGWRWRDHIQLSGGRVDALDA